MLTYVWDSKNFALKDKFLTRAVHSKMEYKGSGKYNIDCIAG
jgi:hypothetical protein